MFTGFMVFLGFIVFAFIVWSLVKVGNMLWGYGMGSFNTRLTELLGVIYFWGLLGLILLGICLAFGYDMENN